VVLIMEGTNDVFNNISNNTIRNNLAAQDDRARSRGVDTLLASIIRFHPGNPKGTSKDAQIAALRNEIASLASARRRWFAGPWTPLCPGPTCFANLYAYPVDNGLHPTANGYTVLADIFRAAIQQAPVPNAVSLIAPPHNAIITSLQVS